MSWVHPSPLKMYVELSTAIRALYALIDSQRDAVPTGVSHVCCSHLGNRKKGRFFYGMPDTGASQWIYTHPEEGAPRTGEGIFPMEVIEVVQARVVVRCVVETQR